MQLTYQKPGKDHPMFGKADFIVMADNQPLAYKVGDQYQPIAGTAQPASVASEASAPKVDTHPLYVLSFKINDEPEEMMFKSKKKLEKTHATLEAKGFVTDFSVTEYQVLV